ncbi:MAG: hypothetical protein AAF402_09975 [Pseudomonadota bacterium]
MTIIEHALKSDAGDLACLINLAREGIPLSLWSDMVEDGQDPMDVGRIRASRDEGGFSYRNAKVCR